MKTTEKKQSRLSRRVETVPQLSLLYSGEQVLVPPRRHELRGDGTPIGREVSANGIELGADKRVSRLHASFQVGVLGDTVLLRDEGSRNGTFVNGRQITEAHLRDGDLINIGDSFLVFRGVPLADAASPLEPLEGFIGSSPRIVTVTQLLRRVAPTPATVLLLGETGTGKEVVANTLHKLSRRAGTIKAVNCSAIPSELAESMFFGHQSGSFTGAKNNSLGFFRAACGGTIFLDEIGEMPLHLQPKLLRVLEERTVLPVGGQTAVPVDVRVIAATNRDLTLAVQNGSFRADLYARLAEFPINLPSLRERREDILQLLVHALSLPDARLRPELVEMLLLYPWPQNVRELFKVALRLRINCMGAPWLDVEMAGDSLQQTSRMSLSAAAEEDDAEDFEASDSRDAEEHGVPDRDELCRLLRQHQGNIVNLARAVKRSRKQVYRWMHKHEIQAADFRAGLSSTNS